MRTTVPQRQQCYLGHTLSRPSMETTTKMHTSLDTLLMTDCCLRGTHTNTQTNTSHYMALLWAKVTESKAECVGSVPWVFRRRWDLLKPGMWLALCWNFQWFPPEETIMFYSTSLQVNTLCLCAQSPGAAQADQRAVGGQDTDLARRAQRNAQVYVKLSTSHSLPETTQEGEETSVSGCTPLGMLCHVGCRSICLLLIVE